jgi:hypothetical protein
LKILKKRLKKIKKLNVLQSADNIYKRNENSDLSENFSNISPLVSHSKNKRNKIKVREVPPEFIKMDIPLLRETYIPSRERSVFEIKNEKVINYYVWHG